MEIGKKYVETTTRHRTRIREMKDESARCCCKKRPSKRPGSEDLLGYFLRMHDSKRRSCSVNEEKGVFTLPCPDSLRRDIEVLRRFIRMHEPRGVLLHEEVVIVTEENEVVEKEVPKEKTALLSQRADAQC